MTYKDKMFLYYCQWTRQAALDITNAYTEGFTTRLIPTFDNIKEEADKASKAYWESAMSSIADEGYHCDGDFAEAATEAGIDVYQDLSFVRQQLIGLSIAGLYHLWERTLKQFIIKELKQYRANEKAMKTIANHNFDGIVEILQQFGHNLTLAPYYSCLNELRLVTNVVKHGEGQSFNELTKIAPQLFDSSIVGMEIPLTLDCLNLSPHDFRRYSGAVTTFWELLPQRMILVNSTPQF